MDSSFNQPLTEELLNGLLQAESPNNFFDEYEPKQHSVSEYLNWLLEQKGLRRAKVVTDAELNATFGYQIFMGTKNAGRDKLLQLSFAMGLSVRETNRLLRLGGHSELYVKNRRDAIILFCLNRGYSLRQLEAELYHFGEEGIIA